MMHVTTCAFLKHHNGLHPPRQNCCFKQVRNASWTMTDNDGRSHTKMRSSRILLNHLLLRKGLSISAVGILRLQGVCWHHWVQQMWSTARVFPPSSALLWKEGKLAGAHGPFRGLLMKSLYILEVQKEAVNTGCHPLRKRKWDYLWVSIQQAAPQPWCVSSLPLHMSL